ncbi:hypothetical protein D9758_014020 [Tetrapyrgos nigripes]|uniref:DUF6533 domain-containing protein n=1 Tax=Tetrapyrgos nigripes TaxID=182062 RepID=A0A8H5CYW5_9AGAR|nr:hypothetical protein D9758_014020 [Tetrapyrgos nigripes]
MSILFWDYIITFGDEINYIWTRPKILSSYCFLLIRYVALLGEIPVTVVKFSMMSTSWQGLDQDIARVEFHPEGCLVTVPLDTPTNPMDTSSSLRLPHLFINTMEIMVDETLSWPQCAGVGPIDSVVI